MAHIGPEEFVNGRATALTRYVVLALLALLATIGAACAQPEPESVGVWTRQFGSGGDDYAQGVDVDGAGNVYVVGWTTGALPGQASAGGFDPFLRKYDPAGQELWTRQFGSFDDDDAYGVAVDREGNVFVAGSIFGALPGQASAGQLDAFVDKFGSAGEDP